MVKKFTIPFASQGDANDIPDALQVDGKVSFTQGFGYDYERPYDDPQAKDIAREDMNGLFKAITTAVGELQTLGASEWSSAIAYPKGAIVYYEKDLYISQVDDNQSTPPQNWVSITNIANDSLKKAANLSDLTNKATARNNLGLGSSATLNKTDILGTSTSLVATQKLVNDTKINLDNSVRAVEDRKRDKDDRDFGGISWYSGINIKRSETNIGIDSYIKLMNFNRDGGVLAIIGYENENHGPDYDYMITFPKSTGMAYTSGNTSVDKSGFLRAHGNKHAITTDEITSDLNVNRSDLVASAKSAHDINSKATNAQESADDALAVANTKITGGKVVQSLGDSKVDVMSQNAVKDVIDHLFGYAGTYINVKSSREKEVTYTNNTDKPIFVAIGGSDGRGNAVHAYVDNLPVGYFTKTQSLVATSVSFIVPPGSTYRVGDYDFSFWNELR